MLTRDKKSYCASDQHGLQTLSMTKKTSLVSCYTKYVLSCATPNINRSSSPEPSQLTHNVHSPHDEKFYQFLSSLEDEYEALRRSGYAGEGFHSKGHRVGQGVSHDLPPHLARARALEAAEKRRNLSNLMSGGRRLGGSLTNTNRSPRELAAEVSSSSYSGSYYTYSNVLTLGR